MASLRDFFWGLFGTQPIELPLVGREQNLTDEKIGGSPISPSAVSRYESRPTQTQGIDNYPGGLEHKERRSPFPTNDSVLCPGRCFRKEQRSLFPTNDCVFFYISSRWLWVGQDARPTDHCTFAKGAWICLSKLL